MARPAPPSDDGSPARLIAAMVGIVGILLLGSLAWSAVGALISAIGAAGGALTSAASPRPLTLQTIAPSTPTPGVALTPTAVVVDAPATMSPSPTVELATATPSPVVTPTPVAAGRNPWILLPQPEPGSKVAAGPVTVEARGRGDAPITAIHLELDGGALPVQFEQRDASTWRGFATARVAAGQHNVRATITDAAGRSGGFRWTFTAG